jgi:ribokinase
MPDYQLITIGYVSLDRFLTMGNKDIKVVCTHDKQHCLLCMPFGDKIPVDGFHETLGGNSANAAVSGARLGIKTATWAVMGNDSTCRLAKEIFKKEGVGLDYFKIDPKVESSVHTIISYQGERTILSYGKEASYNFPQIRSIPWLYLTSLLPGGDCLFDVITKYVNDNKAKLIFQPGHVQLKIPPSKTKDLLKATYIIIMNREEAEEYTGLTSEEEERVSIKKLALKLHSYGPNIVVITDGPKGSYASDGKILYSQGIEDVPAIERTGAGDAYASAFCIAIINNEDIVTAMGWGLLNAQGVISKIGPQAGILKEDKMREQIKNGYPKVVVKQEPLI